MARFGFGGGAVFEKADMTMRANERGNLSAVAGDLKAAGASRRATGLAGRRVLVGLAALLASGLAGGVGEVAGAYPQPSPYPVTWELKLEVGAPRRVVVGGQAYWYLTYTVTNNTGQERVFLPVFEVLTPDGSVTRTDRLIPLNVVREVKRQAGGKFLEQANQIAGEIRLGEDQTRDGVAIWPERSAEDREFTVFFSGFSGETVKVSDPANDGKELTLFKTLKLDYVTPGDAKFRQVNELIEVGRGYVMR